MAKPELNFKEAAAIAGQQKLKGKQRSSPIFVFVDYLFLFIFFCFLSFILYKMAGF